MSHDTGLLHPVIIIGGGPSGLATSIALSQRKIPHLLFERYPGTSIHPKAVGFNPRSVEIFRELGVEAEVLAQRAPPHTTAQTAWYTGLGPSGREIYCRPAWTGYSDLYAAASPAPYLCLPQIRAEPILLRRARELNPTGLFHRSEVLDVEEHVDGLDGAYVSVLVRHANEPEPKKYRARFVIGADGGRFLIDHLQIPWEGQRNILRMISVHFRAPVSDYHEPRQLITWLINPDRGGTIGTGYMYHLGPYPLRKGSGPGGEEWMFAFAAAPGELEDLQVSKDAIVSGKEKLIDRVRFSLGIPDLDIEILTISQWRVEAVVAERYRSAGGRVFLVGDAAHHVPPWGALGLNSGLQDMQNLVWKLDLALRHDSEDSSTGKNKFDALLDTYGTERRPVAQRVARTSLRNLQQHGLVMDKALGIDVSNDAATNVAALERYFDMNHPEHASVRQGVEDAQKILDQEFHAIGAEVGWFYPDESGRDEEVDLLNYRPSTKPGRQLPHAWLSRDGVERVSTRDMVLPDKFLLLARSADWRSREGEYVHVEVIGLGEGEWSDTDGMWSEDCAVGEKGAVLVRPDRIVAWRAEKLDEEVLAGWDGIIARLLRVSHL
ncbi:FAD binding domain-containing protein [Whalleya microplaca]|nr:FAD binding domain-containing protein [Whalleya microplaca]